jgi:hypothetical protein
MPKIRAKAELRDSDGHLLARSTGEFITLAKDEVTSIPEGFKEEMFAILEKLPPI